MLLQFDNADPRFSATVREGGQTQKGGAGVRILKLFSTKNRIIGIFVSGRPLQIYPCLINLICNFLELNYRKLPFK